MEREINWAAYATHYDLMCHHNQEYDETLEELAEFFLSLKLAPGAVVADVGAGTGNYVAKLADLAPDLFFAHIDSNREMNKRAFEKYEHLRLTNVFMIEEATQNLTLENEIFDLIVCINALYAMQPQGAILAKFLRWLKPGGTLYLVDLGRKMEVADWGLHFLRRAVRDGNLLEYVRDSISGREVLRQNRMTKVAQESGRYWMHETSAFGKMLEDSGFSLETLSPCYRGYSDLAICTKPQS